ncbi:MAG: amidohydrolase family protein [Verrucomicrobia bacterium]|nr:amidohydrolase family protein [Verrucomicrobiota bacterium]
MRARGTRGICRARLHHCQLNSLEAQVFQETQYPELFCQDLSAVPLATNPRIEQVSAITGLSIHSLEDWHGAIDWCFAAYGPRAIAIKDQRAYARWIDYADVTASAVAALFARLVRDGESLTAAENKAVQDHLFHYCVRKAAAHNLPVKLHTGYYAGHGSMPLDRVRRNAADMSDLLRLHPQTPFVITHITYPYQDEAIALAKQYTNAYVHLCWAWIINPTASVRFVKEFLMAAPASKLLTFGGDFMPVELVPGHAAIAGQGLVQALTELVTEGWLPECDVSVLVEQLRFRNALALFDYDRASRATPAA